MRVASEWEGDREAGLEPLQIGRIKSEQGQASPGRRCSHETYNCLDRGVVSSTASQRMLALLA